LVREIVTGEKPEDAIGGVVTFPDIEPRWNSGKGKNMSPHYENRRKGHLKYVSGSETETVYE